MINLLKEEHIWLRQATQNFREMWALDRLIAHCTVEGRRYLWINVWLGRGNWRFLDCLNLLLGYEWCLHSSTVVLHVSLVVLMCLKIRYANRTGKAYCMRNGWFESGTFRFLEFLIVNKRDAIWRWNDRDRTRFQTKEIIAVDWDCGTELVRWFVGWWWLEFGRCVVCVWCCDSEA